MKLVVWSPTALLADGIASIIGRELGIDPLVTPQVDRDDLVDVTGLVVHAIPLDVCRNLFSNLAPTTSSTLVSVLLARSPAPLFVSQARLFGFAGVVDTEVDTSSAVTAIQDLLTFGPPVAASELWTLDQSVLLETRFCEHCRDTRDVEILRYIVDGHTDAQIAELMNLNAQTVRNRVSNMLLESGMSNRTQLAIDFFYRILALNGGDTGAVVLPARTLES